MNKNPDSLLEVILAVRKESETERPKEDITTDVEPDTSGESDATEISES